MTHCVRVLPLGLALAVGGCAADTDGASSRGAQSPPPDAMQAQPQAADVADSEPADFGNAEQPAAGAGGPAPVPPAMEPRSRSDCTGGFYLGTYDCEVDLGGLPLPLMGDVSFVLEIDETVLENDCDAEFCPDLVIAEGSGTLFGLAGLVGFEAELDGGLDCATGEFRAEAPSGVWGSAGSSDPSDPEALWTVFDPPFGMFDGSLAGQRMEGPPERIAGDWDLFDSFNGYRCAGPFTVSLQP